MSRLYSRHLWQHCTLQEPIWDSFGQSEKNQDKIPVKPTILFYVWDTVEPFSDLSTRHLAIISNNTMSQSSLKLVLTLCIHFYNDFKEALPWFFVFIFLHIPFSICIEVRNWKKMWMYGFACSSYNWLSFGSITLENLCIWHRVQI